MDPDPYDVLGVPRGASAAEVTAAYRRLARAYHPDAPGGGDPDRMRALNAAHAALSASSPPNGGAWTAPSTAHAPQFEGRGRGRVDRATVPARPPVRLPSRRAVVVTLALVAAFTAVLVVLAATGDEVVQPRTATLVAAGMRFDVGELRLAAGVPVEVRLVNRDVGQRHNVAIYRGDVVVARGEPITGPTAVAYDVGPLPPGTYTFRCEVVPGMTGTLHVTD